MKKTKIVCTLGPASLNETTLEAMLLAGMNVARFNFSHGTHEEHGKAIDLFRRVRDRLNMSAAVLLDTRGPEIRVKNFVGGSAELKAGQRFTITTEDIEGDDTRVAMTYPQIPAGLQVGARVLIDDGRLVLQVAERNEKEVICQVLVGGKVSNHKGINLPNVHLDMPYLSEQDKADLLYGIEKDVDFVAASFVRSRDDVIAMRKFLDYNGGHHVRIIAKIENLEGVENFDEILQVADGIMVARGDMGVEIAFEKLPGIQKRFIRRCYQAGKMVITATQMLESMTNHPHPTRAEITDVANAVFDGTSAVMLSGESAVGKYPVESVEVMSRIICQAEADAFSMDIFREFGHDMDKEDTTNAVCDAACTTAHDLGAKAIITVTQSGQTARRLSKFRPMVPIVAATPSAKTYHQLSLSWGVYPVVARLQSNSDALLLHAVDCAKQIDAVAAGDRVVITAGIPVGASGNTNLIKVEIVQGQRI